MGEIKQLGYYVNGEFHKSKTSKYTDAYNPSTGEVIAKVPCCLPEEIEEAVAAAKAAFPGWSSTPVLKRVEILYRLRSLLIEHMDELTYLVAMENGKAWEEAHGDVLKAKEDIFIEYADLQTFDCGNIAFVWQAPYAGKTYLPQSIARLGQPLYLGDMFIGTESPVGENAIGADKAYCRYNTGRKLSEVCENLVYELPMQIVGAGSADNFVAMRKAFFEYIESISRPFRLRLQFNSWYDNMLDITPLISLSHTQTVKKLILFF